MFQYTLYLLGTFLANSLSLKGAYALASFLSTLQYFFSSTDRLAVKNNLESIFPEKSNAEINRLTRLVFINFGKYLADFFRFSKVDKDYIERKVDIQGLENVDEMLKGNKGVIVISAHLGNWELAGIAVGLEGYKIMGVVLPHKDKRVDRFFNNQRMMNKLDVCPVGRAAYCCLESLKANKMIALVADRDFTEHGVVVDFLNKKALMPKGPAAFHLKTGAPVIAGFLLRNPDDNFKFIFEKPLSFNLNGDKEKDIEIITKACTQIIEKYIKQYPEQWFMFRKYWLDE
jgi:KDO2-lipid IV(A) lauroyltransferase